jgi:fibronectin-binding autotransporter adhesin
VRKSWGTLGAFALLAVVPTASFGAIVSWTSAVSGNWSDGTKWSSNPNPPQPGDDVVINVAGTYTVSLNVDPTINSLTLGAGSGTQTLQTANFRTLTLAGPNASTVSGGGVLHVSGGTLTGASDLTVSGTLRWGAGAISGSGALTVTGTFLCDSSSSKILNGRTLTSNGSAILTGGGGVNLANGAMLHNGATGTFDIQVDSGLGLANTPTTEAFINDGTLLKSGGIATTTVSVPMSSGGPVQVNAGVLSFIGGGSWSGAFSSAGGVLRFGGGTHTWSNVTVGGTGRTEITGGTVNFTGPVTVSSMATLAHSATIGGNGPLTVNGVLLWTAGQIGGGGLCTINGPLTFDSSSSRILNGRTLVAKGGVVWKDVGGINLANGAVLQNAAASTFDIQNAGSMGVSGTPSSERFDNAGTLLKSGPGTTNLLLPVASTGPVNITAGTLALGGGGTWSGVMTLGGGSLRFSGGTHSRKRDHRSARHLGEQCNPGRQRSADGKR